VIAAVERLSDVLARRRRGAAVVAVVLVVALATQVTAPEFAGSMVDQIHTGSRQLEDARLVAAARGGLETLVLLVDAGDSTIGTTFSWLEKLDARLEALSPDITVRSLDRLRDQLFVYGLSPGDRTESLLLAVRDSGGSSVVSRDASTFAVFVAAPATLGPSVLEVLETYPPEGGPRTAGVLAAAALERDVAAGLRDDLRLLIPMIVVVMLVVMWAAFGHWRALFLPVFACIASSVVLFGLLSLSGITINLVTLLALPIVLIVALANSCHFLAKSSAVIETREQRFEAIAITLRKVAVPYLISSFTTAAALASLGFNDIEPIRDLGLLSAAALAVSFLLVMLAAPLALSGYLRAPVAPLRRSRPYQAFSGVVLQHRRRIAAILAAASVLGLASLPALEVQSDARVFFPDSARFTRAFHAFEENFYVFSPVRVIVRRSGPAVGDVDELRFAGEIRSSLESLDGVREVLLTPAVAGGGFLLTTIFDDPTAQELVTGVLDRYSSDTSDRFSIVYSSPQLVYESIDSEAMASLSRSLGTSLIIVFGSVALLVGSLRSLAAALAANAVPLLMTCAVVWFRAEPLNLVSAFVFLVALGVIVDDTIHILYHWRLGGRLAGSSIEFSVVVTTIMLCLGLLLCEFSDFPTTRQFAAYCAIALGAAVISDLSILPLLNRKRQDCG